MLQVNYVTNLDSGDPTKYLEGFYQSNPGLDQIFWAEAISHKFEMNKNSFLDLIFALKTLDGCEYCMDRYYNIFFFDKNRHFIAKVFYGSFNNDPFETSVVDLKAEANGHRKDVEGFIAEIEALILPFKISSSTTAKWYYYEQGGISSINAKIKTVDKINPLVYPQIANLDKMIHDFKRSDEPILLLTGTPGMGKSYLIKYIVNKLKMRTAITFDENVMKDDRFYMQFLRGDDNLMVLEDADVIMQTREHELNRTMSKLLNISDGLISIEDKKMIFTANLKDHSSIDSALLRPGRCFAAIEFPMLTKEQAEELAESEKINLIMNKKQYTVAEIFSQKEQNLGHSSNKIGFL